MKKHQIDLRFCVWEFDDISHDEITALMGLSPTYIHVKGQPKNPLFSGSLAKDNGWIIVSPAGKDASLDEQMSSLLDLLESKTEVLKPLCEKYYCELSCYIRLKNNEEGNPYLHLDARYNKLIRQLDIEFDLDISDIRIAEK
jgi:hypothetical protein